MNKQPLPVHLLTEIPGYRMMGQTAFGGYFRVILSWWENNCPDVLAKETDFRSVAGMKETDWRRHGKLIEPMLIASFEILTKYRAKRVKIVAHRMENLKKAYIAQRKKRLESQQAAEIKGELLDKHTNVNPAPADPIPQPFHEGWNLHKQNSQNTKKKPTQRAMLTDK